MELFYNQYGEQGPPLIILHGLLGAHGNWHTLSRTRFSDEATVYALDQRNHGRIWCCKRQRDCRAERHVDD